MSLQSTGAPVKVWDILDSRWSEVLEVDVMEAGKLGSKSLFNETLFKVLSGI